MITYHCPHCNERLTVVDGKAGQAYVCSLCGQSTLVPGGKPVPVPAPIPTEQPVAFAPPVTPQASAKTEVSGVSRFFQLVGAAVVAFVLIFIGGPVLLVALMAGSPPGSSPTRSPSSTTRPAPNVDAVRFGMTQAQVQSTCGAPDQTQEMNQAPQTFGTVSVPGKTMAMWYYTVNGRMVQIVFENGVVTSINRY